MYLSHLSLTNFRNFLHLELDLPPGVVVFYGSNAQGKTSVLEAIYLLAIARSFRAENEHEVVNWQAAAEAGSALVAGAIEKREERLRIHIGYQCSPTSDMIPPPPGSTSRPFGIRRQIRVSRVKRTAAELVGLVNAVLFNAEDIDLVQGPPSIRRRFMDILLSQVDQSYLKTLQRYQRVLQQRNRLLRILQERKGEEDELTFWSQELIREGSSIIGQRGLAMNAVSDLCRERHAELTGDTEDLAVRYRPNVPRHGDIGSDADIQREFSDALEATRGREMGTGSTAVGPHRDDFTLSADGVNMGTYASRGQARTIGLSLRLAEAAYLKSIRGEEPILLLDDVLSELDSFRRSRVLEVALQYQQVIITTTDLDSIRESDLGGAAYHEVSGGMVSPDTAEDKQAP